MNFCEHKIEVCHDCAETEDAKLSRLRVRVAELEEKVKRAEAALCRAREAIIALRTMRDVIRPTKLDEALSWRENDELAEKMALEALGLVPSCPHKKVVDDLGLFLKDHVDNCPSDRLAPYMEMLAELHRRE